MIIFLHLIIFFLLVIFIFSIPGIAILKKTKTNLPFGALLTLGTVTGFVAFTLLSYLFLLLHLDWLPLILFSLVSIFYFRKIKLPKLIISRNSLILFFVLFTGIMGQLLIIAPSGINIGDELVFWSAHGHDGVWHLALVEEIKKGFPLENPVLAGERLVNYHYFSDISIALFNKYFSISSLDLYFRFFPLLFSALLGSLAYLLGKFLGKNFLSGIWACIFTFFAGSFGYLIMIPRNGSLEGESFFWSSQVQSVSGNPPQAIAFVILLSFILLFVKLLEKNNIYSVILLSLLAGSLAVIKVYASVILLMALFFVGIWQILKVRKIFIISVFLISSLISALLYLPNTVSSGNLLILEPWWFIRTMVVADNRLNWLDLELRRQTYLAHNNWKWVLTLEGLAFLIFLIGNLGLRFIGFFDLFKSSKIFFKDYFIQLYILIIFFSLVLPLLFIQKGVPGNTIQFLQFFLLLFGLLAGVSTVRILQHVSIMPFKIIISLLILFFAIPTQIGLLHLFYKQPPFAKISAEESKALKELTKLSDQNATILAQPFNKKPYGETPPIWLWSDTSYIPAFSGRNVFIADIEQLDIMGYDFIKRQEIQKRIFATLDPIEFVSLLKQNQIDFIYFSKEQKPTIDLTQTSLQNIYTNSEIEIWKVI